MRHYFTLSGTGEREGLGGLYAPPLPDGEVGWGEVTDDSSHYIDIPAGPQVKYCVLPIITLPSSLFALVRKIKLFTSLISDQRIHYLQK